MKERLWTRGDTPKRAYLLLLAFVLAAFGIFLALYSGFQRALWQSVTTLNNDFISQVGAMATSAESILQNTTAQMFNNRSVAKLRTYEKLSNTDMIDGIRVLNDFVASSAVIDSIYVYNGKQGYVYSTANYGAVSDRADAFADEGAIALFLNRTADQRLQPIGRYTESSTSSANRSLFSLMMFEVDREGQCGDNALMLNISSAWFSQLYFGGDQEGAAFIMDGSGALISASAGMAEDARAPLAARVGQLAAAGGANGYFDTVGADGQRRLCFYMLMEKRGWYYVRSMPYDKYLAGLTDLLQTAYVFFAIAFLLTLLGAVVILVRVYSPFRHMRASLSTLESKASAADPVEQLNALIKRTADISHINEALRALLHDEALRGLLLNEGTPDADYAFAFARGASVTPILVNSTRIAQLLEAARALCPRAEGVVLGGEHTVLLVEGPPLDALCGALLKPVPTRRLIVGWPVSFPDGLAPGYAALLEGHRLRFLYADERVRTLRPDEPPEDSSLPAERQIEKILESVKGANRAALTDNYAKFRRALYAKTYRSVQYALTHLNRSVLRLYYELFPDAAPPYQEECARFDALVKTLDDMRAADEYFEERFVQMMDMIRHDRRGKQGDAVQEALKAIQSGYTDPGLSSQSVADALNMSPAYLCRVFKQAQDVSLPDCINALRIAEAKRLLRETDVMVKDVGPQVGLVNVQYFFVLFKRATGMTPRQYRAERPAQ